jgi:hypothetical protein
LILSGDWIRHCFAREGRSPYRAFVAAIVAVLLLVGSRDARADAVEKGPWFTGPLLAPTPALVPPGHVFIQPYLFISDSLGRYNSNWTSQSVHGVKSVNPQYVMQIGVVSFMDFTLIPSVMFNWREDQFTYGFGDLPFILGFQLLAESEPWWAWQTKLTFSETLPFGRYNQLNPEKKGTDVTGSGSTTTTLAFIVEKTFHLFSTFYLKPRLAVLYDVRSSVPVDGLNVYGGSAGLPNVPGSRTVGEVFPGRAWSGYGSFEFSMTQNFVFAWDTYILNIAPVGFRGVQGTDPIVPAKTDTQQISIAPTLEWNFSANYAILAGVWFSVAGKNTSDFVTPTISATIYQ